MTLIFAPIFMFGDDTTTISYLIKKTCLLLNRDLDQNFRNKHFSQIACGYMHTVFIG